MPEELARAVYAVLVELCGASARPDDIASFVAHCTSDTPGTEYRFVGSLGFGGKFRYPGMTVDCYPEDATPHRQAAIGRANERLAQLCLASKPAAGCP